MLLGGRGPHEEKQPAAETGPSPLPGRPEPCRSTNAVERPGPAAAGGNSGGAGGGLRPASLAHDKPLSGDEADPSTTTPCAQQAFDAAAQAVTDGHEDEAVHKFLTASKLAERAHEWYLAALSFRRVGDFLLNPKPPCDLDRALHMLPAGGERLRALRADGRGPRADLLPAPPANRRGREMNLPFWRRAELWLYWAVAGYGLRPLRVVGTAGSIVLLFGILYWSLGGVIDAGTKAPAGLWECLYFSGITFATVGYGDFVPAPSLRPLALLEALGPLTMGFFVVVLANRLRR